MSVSVCLGETIPMYYVGVKCWWIISYGNYNKLLTHGASINIVILMAPQSNFPLPSRNPIYIFLNFAPLQMHDENAINVCVCIYIWKTKRMKKNTKHTLPRILAHSIYVLSPSPIRSFVCPFISFERTCFVLGCCVCVCFCVCANFACPHRWPKKQWQNNRKPAESINANKWIYEENRKKGERERNTNNKWPVNVSFVLKRTEPTMSHAT